MTDGPALSLWAFGALIAVLLAVSLLPLLWASFGPTLGIAMTACIAAVPLWRVRGWVRARHKDWQALRGCCRACGYDLRASTTRCPECGGPVPRSAM